MSKRALWPLALIIFALIYLATNMRLMPASFWNLWPLMAIVIGLGGLLISDREEWMSRPSPKKSQPSTATASKPTRSLKAKTRRK